MRVALTGGTGFIGSHCVAALQRQGHDVRMLVRDQAKAQHAIALHELDPARVEVVLADLTDAEAMRAGLEGVDAAVHVAAVFSLNPNDAATMAKVNPTSTELVIATGRELGLDPIVYVSTMGVFIPSPDVATVGPEAPVSTGCGPYTASKVAAEKIARRHQKEGAPVVCVYPGAVIGPRDPNASLSDSMAVILEIAKGRMPTIPKGAKLGFVDVRDIAALCAGAIEPGKGPRRYLAYGHDTPLREVPVLMTRLTGRKLTVLPTPKLMLSLSGRLADAISRLTGKALPLSNETTQMLLATMARPDVDFDQSAAAADFGFPGTPFSKSLEDTLRWLHAAGHLGDEDVGQLGST